MLGLEDNCHFKDRTLSINVQTGNHTYILYEPVPQLHGAKLKISCHEPHAEACSNLEEDLVFPLTQVN